jgi:branched-chain amino acid aminotransferase
LGAYINSALAAAEARMNGYDEVIMLTQNGDVSEGPAENLFLYRQGRLITPPVSDDILEGITRDTVILVSEIGRVPTTERSIPRVELYSGDEAFFTGTLVGILPIVEVDQRRIGSGKEGPLTRLVRKWYERVVYGEESRYSFFITPVY